MKKIFSCDWGTSSFRLRLIDTNDLHVIAAENSTNGIAYTQERWAQSNREIERTSFFRKYLEDQVRSMEDHLKAPLKNIPILLSGMASSSIGMFELPYKKLPFSTDGSDLILKNIEATDQFPHGILLISGACTHDDVMRGEETQLVGVENTTGKMIYIFPGTHSKHVFVENGKAVDFKTYMTGEFFELLSVKSILAQSVESGQGFETAENKSAFVNGIRDGIRKNLLHASFKIRTNSLFNKISREGNYHYLSGLLIGSELKELLNTSAKNITVVANGMQTSYYERAFYVLGDELKNPEVTFVNAEEATIKGQMQMCKFGNVEM